MKTYGAAGAGAVLAAVAGTGGSASAARHIDCCGKVLEGDLKKVVCLLDVDRSL